MTDTAAPGESDRTGIGAGPAGPPSFPGNAPPPPPGERGPPAFPAGAATPGGDPAAFGNVPYASWGLGRRHISAVPFLITGVLYGAYGTLVCGGSRRGKRWG